MTAPVPLAPAPKAGSHSPTLLLALTEDELHATASLIANAIVYAEYLIPDDDDHADLQAVRLKILALRTT